MNNQVYELLNFAFQNHEKETAIIHQEESISYSELENRIHAIANKLKTKVPSERIIGISCDRSIQTILNLLAILAAGKTYLPLDFDLPKVRLKKIVEEADLTYFLPGNSLEPFEELGLNSINSSKKEENQIEEVSKYAYILFTSGSTGIPKGVCMPHLALINLVEWQNKNSKSTIGFNTLHFAKLTFDASFLEIFCSLSTGGTLHIVDNQLIRDPYLLLNYIDSQSINRLFLPFIALQGLCNAAKSYKIFPSCLKEVMTAGEQLKITDSLRRFFSELPTCKLFNQYGPTESHVVTQLYLQGDPQFWEELPTIGMPIQNSRVDIVSERGEIISKEGEIGELYLSGVCLADGYLNREELTNDKFIQFAGDNNSSYRVYKSGDLGYWNKNGEISFIGRTDDQIKINGFRVEIGEVELEASKIVGVDEFAIVKSKNEDGQFSLKLFYTSLIEKNTEDFVRKELLKVLPEYMVPTKILKLDKLPKTTSGKVDRNQLALILDEFLIKNSTEFGFSNFGLEHELTLIWNSILQENRIESESNFFDLGGSSILAQKLSSKIKSNLDIHFPVTLIYQNPTIKDQVKYLANESTFNSVSCETDEEERFNFEETLMDINNPPFPGAKIGLDKEGMPCWIKNPYI
ncbi:non-ribosomal peptide synthetase [Algoriphagus sp. SE2]|uniref:non-ribosomal peptide synthetase n=1 Tax=Algoriphagus sp. SE2 TaxID=3141536 RepID=UPI0031CCF248